MRRLVDEASDYPFIVPPDPTVSVTLTRDKLNVVVNPRLPEAA